jgi:FkbM family methyltransferase
MSEFAGIPKIDGVPKIDGLPLTGFVGKLTIHGESPFAAGVNIENVTLNIDTSNRASFTIPEDSAALKEIADRYLSPVSIDFEINNADSESVQGFIKRETARGELIDCLTAVADSAWAQKDLTAARHAYNLVLDQDAANTHAMNRLGRIALAQRNSEQAIEHFSAAFLINPEPIVCVNLAVAYGRAGDFTQALTYCAEAITLDRLCKNAYVQQSALYDEMGQPNDAEDILIRALELFPGDDNLLFALGVHQLARGDYDRGWRHFEHRIARLELLAKLDEYQEWQGEPLGDRIILVCGEQGAGDQIMWARYLPLLRELGAEVVCFTKPELARLFAQSFPDVQIVTTDQELKAIEPDYWIAMGSLPLRACGQIARSAFAVERRSVRGPADVADPYLAPNDADVAHFAPLIPNTGNLRVGLCWRGNPQHMFDKYRSLSWEQMKPLLDVPGVDFYSLQSADRESGLPLLVNRCHDFAETAAAIAHLDLVITVDTAVAHLAGAMGKPVWTLLGMPTDWRWGNGISAFTSWYPAMVVFRSGSGNGVDPITAAVRCLKNRISERGGAVVARVAHNHEVAGSNPAPATISAVASGPCRYGEMRWHRNDHYVGRSLALYGEYSEAEADLYRRILKPGDLVIEAGANIGAETLALAKIVGPTGQVLAFEPQPEYMTLLRENTGHLRNVVRFYDGLGSKHGELQMSPIPLDVMHAPGWCPAIREASAPSARFDVGVQTIDWLGKSPALIKVDVDGVEHEILKGAEQTIDRCRPLIYVEHDKPEQYPDMLPWLAARGYRLYQHLAPLYNPANFAGNHVNVFGSVVSLMVLAVPNERKDLHPGEWGLERIRVEKR